MSIIYSYPEQGALNANDMLIGTSAEKVGGKQKNITRNFSVQQIADFINGGAGFIDPVASDFQIAVFNQAGKKITGSIMSQDAFPGGTGITISGNLTATGNITTPLNLTANGVVSLGGQANLISLNSVTKLGGPIQDATGTLGNVNQILLSNGSGVVTWQNYEAGLTYEGTWDALNNTTNGLSNSPALVSGVGVSGHFYIVNVEGTTSLGPGLNDWHVGDWAIFLDEGGQPASWQKIDNTSTLVGSGTAGTFAKWTNATTLNDSIMSESGTVVSVDGDLKVKDTIQATTGPSSSLKLKGVGTGGIEIMSADGNTDGKITLNCSQNSHGVTLQSPAHGSTVSYTLILPTSFGGAGDVLTSAGANPSQLVWTTPTTGTVTGTGTENYVTKWSTGGAGIENSTIFDNGTNVGIGTTSSSAKLEVAGDIRGTESLIVKDTGGTKSLSLLRELNYATINNGAETLNYNALSHVFLTGLNEKMRIDSSGNVGVNVVPQNSAGTWRNFQLGGGSITTRANGSNDIIIGTGFYFTTSNTELYKNNAAASRAFFDSDVIRFQNTPSGTAGSAISWSERMTIDSSGNVGIGKTNPDVKLEVVEASPTDGIIADFVNSTNSGGTTAAIKLSNADSDLCDVVLGANRVGANFGSDFFISLSDDIDGSNQERFRITETGNVGIGTTSPSKKLHVDSGTISDIARFENDNGSFTLGQTSSLTSLDLASSNAYRIRQGSDVPFYIKSDGNVGIGTISPSAKLEVEGTGELFRINSSDANGGYATFSNNGTGIGYVGSSYHLLNSPNNDSDNLAIRAQNKLDFATGSSLKMRIDSSGNVGIGTNSPSEKLHVVGDTKIEGTLFVENTNNQIRLVDSDSSGHFSVGVNTNFQIRDIAGSTTPVTVQAGTPSSTLFLKSSGNVGIGTSSPAVSLDISATDAVQMPVGVTGDRPTIATGVSNGMLRYNSSNNGFEGYINGNWGDIGGGTSGGLIFRGTFDASTGTIAGGGNLTTGATRVAIAVGDMYIVDTAGDFYGDTSKPLNVGDEVICVLDAAVGTSDVNDWNAIASGAGGAVTGSGTTNYVPKFTGATVVGNSSIFNDATGNVGIGTTSPQKQLHVNSGTTNVVARFESTDTTAAIEFKDNNGSAEVGNIGDNIVFFPAGAEKMRIEAGGNVGIGTASPSEKLEVAGNVTLRDSDPFLRLNGSNHAGIMIDRGSTSYDSNLMFATAGATKWRIWNDGSDDTLQIRDEANAANVMTWETGGNVGIGTSSPSAKLDVAGDIRVDSTSVAQIFLDSAASNDAVLNFHENASQKGKIGYDTSLGGIALVAGSGSFSTADMVLLDNGNVGIGTTSPAEKLEVTGNAILDASNANLKLKSGVTGTKGDIQWTFDSDSTVYASVGIEYDNRTTDGFLIDSGYAITLDTSTYTRFSKSGTEHMRIASSGNVGIGTTSPVYPLDVAKSTGSAYMRLARTYAGSESNILFGAESTRNLIQSRAGTSNSAQRIDFLIGSTQRLSLGTAGQIGLSSTNYGTDGQVLTSKGPGSAAVWQAAGGGLPTKTVDTFTGSGQSFIDLTVEASSVNYIDMYIDGVYQAKATYTIATVGVISRITLVSGTFPTGVNIETVTTT